MVHNYFAMHGSKSVQALLLAIVVIGVSMMHPCKSLSTSSASPSLCEFPAIFNFGDSNSDTGGRSAAFGQIGPPHGQTFFHAPAGRYSDGRHIIDFIAESFGLPYLNGFLDSVGSNFSHGANFATAGSTIRPQTTIYYSPFSLKIQSNQFYDFHQRSQIFRDKGRNFGNNLSLVALQGLRGLIHHLFLFLSSEDIFKKLLPKAEYFSEALYTFDIGQNDLVASYFPNMSIDQVKETIPDMLDQFKTYAKSIYEQGARYFWIHNTGPLGCLPYVLDGLPLTTQMDPTGCAIPINELAQYFNFGLKKAVAQLREDMPLASITYVDVYSIKYDLISNANKYGFIYPLKACCGQGGKYNYDSHKGCGARFMDHGKEILVGACNNPLVKINWDGAHYTDAANKWVFDRLDDGLYSDPPISLKKACYKD